MGQVLLVESQRQPEPVALKLLQSQLMTDARVEGFKREFALLSELHHPHLPRVYDFGLATSRNQYFFSTEFVEGQELYRALRQAPFEEVEHVLMQVLSALDFLHSIGLVHFDVKGENVLVEREANGNWNAKLVDFGVTSPANRELTEVAGTLHYIAPELLLPDPVSDGRSDLYSFGVMCYYLLAGQFPYSFQSFDDVWEWHRHHPQIDLEPLRLRGVPDYFCQLIERLMKPNPSDRFSSAGVVLNYLALHSGVSQADLPTIQRAQIAEGPFVGRTGLMATVKNALQAATKRRSKRSKTQENTPRAFLLSGRDGMGKSRFLQELKYAAQLVDYTVRIVDAREMGDSIDRFRIALGVFNTALSVDETHKALMTEAQTRPLCLAIDNIHNAAPNVKQLVYSLMGTLYNASLMEQAPPLVLVVTTGDEQLPSTVGAIHVTMAPLSRDEVETYLRQLIGTPEDFDAFCNSVWEFSSGIPLLMAEAARQYHQQGKLPASIEELYRETLSALSPQALRILHTLAFAAVPLPAAVLELIAGVVLDKEILPLTQQGLLRYDDANAHYSLSTGALAAVLTQQITTELAAELADPLLAWVDSTPGNTPVDAARYAAHSRDLVRASRILEQAIETCERTGKALQAIDYLKQLVVIREKLSMHGEVIALRRRIATHHLYQGHLEEAESDVRETMNLTGTSQVEELKLLGLIYRVRRNPEEAGKLYDQALNQITLDPTDPTYLFLQNERALAYLEAGNVAKAIPILMQTHREAKALPFEKQRRVTNNNLGAALARAGQLTEAIAFYKEKLRLFQHDLRLQGSISSQLASVQVRAGLIDDAIMSFETAWQIAQKTGDMHNGKIILENIIALYQKQTSYSRALQYAKKSLELKSVGSSPQDMGRTLMTLATLYLNLGVPDLAARYLIQAMRIVRRSRDHQLLGWIHINFGYLYKDLGRLMESINAFEETMYTAEEHKDDELMRWGQYGAADALVDHGELEEAKPYMATLETVLPKVQDPEFRARVAILRNRILVMKSPKPTPDIVHQLLQLVEDCQRNQWSELEWEVEYLLGTLYQKRDEFEQVRSHMSRAAAIIQGIADGLSEEFRNGFLKQRVRARVFSELHAAEHNEVYVTEVTSMSEGSQSPQPSADDVEASRATSVFAAASAAAPAKTEAAVPVIRSMDDAIHFDPDKPLIEYEREIIEATLLYYQNDMDDTARALGITTDALGWKLEQLGITAAVEPETDELTRDSR
jgi:tetratricopeptide (TPR) repeat protein